MKRPLPLLGLLAACSSGFAELDLTPVEHAYELEGVPMTETQFRQGEKIIRYEPPAGWSLQGSGSLLTLEPAHIPQARAVIKCLPKPQNADFSDAVISALREQVQHHIPRDASELVILAEVANPLRINRHDTWEVIFQFSRGGRTFKHSALVCNFQDNQMWFELYAPAAEFSKLHTAFQKSLFTLQGLD